MTSYYGSPIVNADIKDTVFYYYIQAKGAIQTLNVELESDLNLGAERRVTRSHPRNPRFAWYNVRPRGRCWRCRMATRGGIHDVGLLRVIGVERETDSIADLVEQFPGALLLRLTTGTFGCTI